MGVGLVLLKIGPIQQMVGLVLLKIGPILQMAGLVLLKIGPIQLMVGLIQLKTGQLKLTTGQLHLSLWTCGSWETFSRVKFQNQEERNYVLVSGLSGMIALNFQQ